MFEAVRSALVGRGRRSATLLALCIGFFLAASCSQTSEPEPAHLFPEAAARALFADGYRHVRDRYIEPVRVNELALAGLGGLEHVAPTLTIKSDGSRVRLLENGRTLRAFEQPGANDSNAWAGLTAAVLQAGWVSSPALREMRPEEIYNSVFSGILTRLDGYSRYTDAESSKSARAARDGFGGVGVTISTIDGKTMIVHVLPGTPAEGVGLEDGDQIVAVNGRSVLGLSHGIVVDRLRGREGSELRLTVRRGTPPATLEVSLVREHIVPRTVWYRRHGDVAYFRLTSFNRQTTADLSRRIDAARSEIGPKMAGIVLDLRGNPGGLLDQAVGVADLFLSKGLIIATRGRHPASNSIFTATGGDLAGGLPVVVLINGRSASASELLAAALQDQGRAVVVGSSSHGKGSVQNVARLPNGGEFIITWSRMVAPSGYILDRLGVLPSVCTSDDETVSAGAEDGPEIVAASTVSAWHEYATPDEAIARTLRLGCPAVREEPRSDVRLAERVLHDTQLYAQALRPWMGTVTASRDSRS